MLSNILSYLKARPALVAAVVSIGGTIAAAAGLHLTAAQLAGFVTMFNAVLGTLVHVQTSPAGKHEAGKREEHP